MSYYSFHNHTDFSNASCGFMDSINKTEDLINYAYQLGLKGLAITDHESVSSHVRAVQHYIRIHHRHLSADVMDKSGVFAAQ